MSTFITLPSGLRINTAHILEYREWTTGKTSITQNVRDPEGGRIVFEEDMTAAELDALLSPPTSAIISPVIDLDKLKPGAGCQFTYEGVVKHGVIGEFGINNVEPTVDMVSDGEDYTLWLLSGELIHHNAS